MALTYANYFLTANARRSGSALNLRFGFNTSSTSTDTLYHLRSASADLFNFCINLDECPWAAKNGLSAHVYFVVDGVVVFNKTWFVPTASVMTTSTVNYSATGTETLADLWTAFGSQSSTAKTCRLLLQFHYTNGIGYGGTTNAGYVASSSLKSYKDITFTARMYAASGASTSYVLYNPLTVTSEVEEHGLEGFVPASLSTSFNSLENSLKKQFSDSLRSLDKFITTSLMDVEDTLENHLMQLSTDVEYLSDVVGEPEDTLGNSVTLVEAVSAIDQKIGDPGTYVRGSGAFSRPRTLFGVLGACRSPRKTVFVYFDKNGEISYEKTSDAAVAVYESNGDFVYYVNPKPVSETPPDDEGFVCKEFEYHEFESTIGETLGYLTTPPVFHVGSGYIHSKPSVGIAQSLGVPLVTYSDTDGFVVRTLFDMLGLSGFQLDQVVNNDTLLGLLQQAISEVGVVSNDSKTIVDNTQQVVTNIEQVVDDNKKMVSALNLLFDRIRVLLSQRNKKIL